MSDERIAKNKLVYFTYQIADDKGEILERVDMPVSYVHGTEAGILEKVEKALEGHRTGDKVTVEIGPEEGFGETDESLTYTDDIENVPEQFRQIGAQVEMQNDQGAMRQFRVSRIENGKLTLDGNHPLSGKALIFTLWVGEIRVATAEEIVQHRATNIPSLH